MSPHVLTVEAHVVLENGFESGCNGGELDVGVREARSPRDGSGIGTVVTNAYLGNRVEHNTFERNRKGPCLCRQLSGSTGGGICAEELCVVIGRRD